ncbi:MAG: NAD(P)-binding protein [Candidatus Omnitrophica bacterium]|nr:NAD(P)-binding protein [Candidatus Omnitrophota bacterium]
MGPKTKSAMYDVIIIGAGPAGLMAARTLKKSGARFLVLDRKKEIGFPLRCGEAIRASGFTELFGPADFPFVSKRVSGHRVIFGDTQRDLSTDFIELDRPGFEKWLCREVSGEVEMQNECAGIEVAGGHCRLTTNKGTERSRIAIIANGCDFRLQKQLGLVKNTPLLAPCVGGIYEFDGLDESRFKYVFDDRNEGYFWIFPKSATLANVGYGSFAKKTDISERFRALSDRYAAGAREISFYAGTVPVGGPIARTYAPGIMVCGSAAGQVYAGTGEGIYYALKAGQLAALTALRALEEGRFDGHAMKKYEFSWKRAFGKHMRAGIISRDLIKLAYRIGRVETLIKAPGEKDLKALMVEGEVPFKIALKWHILKLSGKL